MKDSLASKDLKDFEADLDRISRLWRGWSAGNRTMDRMALEKEAYSVLGRYFDGIGRDVLGAVLRNPEEVVDALPSYGDYSEGSRRFGGLDPAWKSYGNGMLEVSAELGTGLSEAEAGMFRLVEAEQTATEQYEAMKKRICFMYDNGETLYWYNHDTKSQVNRGKLYVFVKNGRVSRIVIAYQ